MNLLAVVGSPRKGKATDLLVDRAVEGAMSVARGCRVKKINLVDHRIEYCRNCLMCRESKTDGPVAPCAIKDDMDWIRGEVLRADALLLGTPVHMGNVPALTMAFLERLCWTFAKPERKVLTVRGAPRPRGEKRRKAAIIVVSGIVPPLLRGLCDTATPVIRTTFKDSLNAQTVGSMYAGDVEHRGVERYLDQAYKLGKRLMLRGL